MHRKPWFLETTSYAYSVLDTSGLARGFMSIRDYSIITSTFLFIKNLEN
jgi:hypothetical protein